MDLLGTLTGETSITKRSKMIAGVTFLQSFGPGLVKFCGIVGSVSYDPSPDDDIDIFIISREGRLWITVIYTFILRRVKRVPDICPSLFMSSSYALNFFRKQTDPLISMDAVRAYIVKGSSFYHSLLGESEYIRRNYPDLKLECGAKSEGRSLINVIDMLIFPFAASFLKIKELFQNRRYEKRGENLKRFKTVVSPGCMYLDSEKYRRLREEAMRNGSK